MRLSERVVVGTVVGVVAIGMAFDRRAGRGEAGLVQDRAIVGGHTALVRHSAWDNGRTQHMFDADPATYARTRNSNPAVVEVALASPRTIERVVLTTASMPIGLRCTATLASGEKRSFSREYRDLPADPTVSLELEDLAAPVSGLRVEVSNLDGGDGHIHIRTLNFSEAAPQRTR